VTSLARCPAPASRVAARRRGSRTWPRVAALLGLVGCSLGCAASAANAGPSTLAEPHPRGAVWPSPAPRAEATNGFSLLRPPRSRELGRRAVDAFFEAVRHESVTELSASLGEDATISSGPGTAPESITKVWSARFKQLDYGFSGANHPYRADDIGLFTASELLELRGARRFQLAPEGEELLAVVNTRDRRHLPGPRHFGKRLEFLLRPTADGYAIQRMFEDFQKP